MADPMTEAEAKTWVLDAAKGSGACLSTLSPSARKNKLDEGLEKAGKLARPWSISEPKGWEDALEVTVLVPGTGNSPPKMVVVLVPVEPSARANGKAGPKVAEERQNDDDAVIRGVADLLEAKVRTERVAKTWQRGPASDPGIVYDTMELALRTVREAMTLSSRAQRVLMDHLERAAPKPRDRVAALQLPEGVVRLTGGGQRFEGGFRLTNRTSRWMRPKLSQDVVLMGQGVKPSEFKAKVTTGSVEIAPGATQRVWITLEIDAEETLGEVELYGVLKDLAENRYLADIPILIQRFPGIPIVAQ
jgi:hypothetical protein